MRLSMQKKITRAISGLISVLTSDSSVRLMCIIGIVVIAASFWIGISRIETVIIVVVVFLVIVFEGINTILEKVIDFVEPRYKPLVRETKDALAGLVLLESIGAAVVGVLIFFPYLMQIFG